MRVIDGRPKLGGRNGLGRREGGARARREEDSREKKKEKQSAS